MTATTATNNSQGRPWTPSYSPTFRPELGIRSTCPVTANEEPEGAIELPRQLVGDGALFALKVTGDSMINAGIFDGDLVVVRQQAAVSNGDIVVALLGGEATVKTVRHSDGHIWLIPQNPAYAPILGDDATIPGRVVSVIRRI